jgi:uncharacterized protein (DUF983 family)
LATRVFVVYLERFFDTMNVHHPGAERSVTLPDSGGARFATAMGRAIRRKCPYCGGGGIFKGWFTLKERCPHCNTLFEHEEGFFLGSYVINIGFTEVVAVLAVIWLIVSSGLSVLEMQIYGAALAIALPIAFYPIALLIWIALDLSIHDPADFSKRVRQ